MIKVKDGSFTLENLRTAKNITWKSRTNTHARTHFIIRLRESVSSCVHKLQAKWCLYWSYSFYQHSIVYVYVMNFWLKRIFRKRLKHTHIHLSIHKLYSWYWDIEIILMKLTVNTKYIWWTKVQKIIIIKNCRKFSFYMVGESDNAAKTWMMFWKNWWYTFNIYNIRY